MLASLELVALVVLCARQRFLCHQVLILLIEPGFRCSSARGAWWVDLLGIVIAFFGQACRALAIGQAENIRRGGRQKKVSAQNLITHGVYAQTRNPLYLGNLLIICGLGL